MKKRLFVLVLTGVAMVLVAGCTLGTVAQTTTPAPNAQAGTPAPGGEINVPGVTIQLYTPGPNPLVNTADAHGHPAGILLGIWHGLISPVTLILSFMTPAAHMYEVHNDGSQYNLGFLLGVALVFIILGVRAGSRRR